MKAIVNVAYSYRTSDRLVWQLGISNAYLAFHGRLHSIDLGADLAAIRRALGTPAAVLKRAPVVESYWWFHERHGYQIDAYSEQYDDIVRSRRVGDIDSVLVFDRVLAPEGYDADLSARRAIAG